MASDMVCDITNEIKDFEELEVSESDTALLRDFFEELENEETKINKENENEEKCLVESSVDDLTRHVNMFDEHVAVDQQPEYSYNIYELDWVDLIEASSTLHNPNDPNDIAVSDWYGSDNTVGIVGFEHCNNVGDYSYLYNDMTYNFLWEDENS